MVRLVSQMSLSPTAEMRLGFGVPGLITLLSAQFIKQALSVLEECAWRRQHLRLLEGTTCPTVLVTRSIFSECYKWVSAGMNAMDTTNADSLGVYEGFTHLETKANRISMEETVQESRNLAHGEQEIGKCVAWAMAKDRKEEANLPHNELEVVDGMKLDLKYMNPSLISNVRSSKWQGAPEFTYQMTRKAIWVDGGSTTAWVNPGFTMTAESRLQSRASYGTRAGCGGIAQGFDSRHMHGPVTTNEAIATLKNNIHQGITADLYTYIRILQMCLKEKNFRAAKQVHKCIIERGMDKNSYVATTLMNVYIRCGRHLDARRVFDQLEKKTLITWTAMIAGYANSDQPESAFKLFNQMRQAGAKPNEVTYLTILKGFSTPLALRWGKEVHACIANSGLESDVRVGTALIHMYAKSGAIDDARLAFDRIQKRDIVTWNAMIGGLSQHGCGDEAYRLFLQMRREGFEPDAYTYASILIASASEMPLERVKEVHAHARKAGLQSDLRVGNALVHMYAKSGDIDGARQVFERMQQRDRITWNTIIGGLAQHGCGHEAYRQFLQMRREGFEPDAVTYVNILDASASEMPFEWLKDVHGQARKGGLESDLRVGSALVHMYAKTGGIDDARQIFNRMGKRDVVTWNIMLGGLAQHGCGHEALELFRKMKVDGVKPDKVSFAGVLSACCHSGLLDEGRRLFSAVTRDYGIEPDVLHYTSMVDLLGRAGHLEEAKSFISAMPVAPDEVTWKTLLGACRTYGDVKLGELAAAELFKLEPNDASAYVQLSNIYAAAGKWEKASLMRSMMQLRGLRKEPGRSWIEVDNRVHEFAMGDTSHPQAKEIHSYIDKLMENLKAAGYIPDTRLVLQDIDEEEKELALCSHSEKLAIAFGLMQIPLGRPIRVYKNLRVCSDCHTATKVISKVTGREIIARDANRFHHFKDGVCSCRDYW